MSGERSRFLGDLHQQFSSYHSHKEGVTRTGQPSVVDPDWRFFRGNPFMGWSISPDGSRVALRELAEGGYDIWVKQLDAGPRSRVTFDEAEDKMPVWEPGGENVTFLSNRNGNFDVWSRAADGTGRAELILDLDENLRKIEWSPDGAWLLLETVGGDVLGYRPVEGGEPTPLLVDEYWERDPTVSPDGRWLAYTSNETGQNQVYVRPFPNVGAGRWQLSEVAARLPRWAHSGRELYFDQDAGVAALWSVTVNAAERFEWEAPVLLFDIGTATWVSSAQTGSTYDVAPDDQRFLIATPRSVGGGGQVGAAGPARVLVNNFFEELRRLAPAN